MLTFKVTRVKISFNIISEFGMGSLVALYRKKFIIPKHISLKIEMFHLLLKLIFQIIFLNKINSAFKKV